MDYHTKVMSVQCPPKCLNVAFAHYDISIRVYALQCYVRKDSSRASVLRHGGCTILDIGVFVGEGDAVSACFGPLDRCNALATKHFRIVSGFEPNPLDRIFFFGMGFFLIVLQCTCYHGDIGLRGAAVSISWIVDCQPSTSRGH